MTATAATIAASLLVAMAAIQVALALGAPLGGIVWGGRYQGKLPTTLRIGSAAAVLILVLAALVILAQAGLLSWSPVPTRFLAGGTWIIAGYMALNTLGNLASKSRFERLAFGPMTALIAVLCVVVALNGSGPT